MVRRAQESPLIGRELELVAAVEALHASDGPGALIAGPAGVGKSRLAREAADRVRGQRVLSVRCPVDVSGLVLGALAGLLPPVDGSTTNLSPVQLGLLGLRRLAAQGSVVLSVDDAHRLDRISLAVLHQAVIDRIVTLLATVRTDEPVPEAVTALWKDVGLVRIDLPALDQRSSDALLTSLLEGPVEGQTLRRLRDTAGGNPLFLRELVISAQEAGLLTWTGGLWRLTGPMTAVPRLTELLAHRLAVADAVERDVLEVVAAGEPLPLPVAVSVADVRVLEVLERRGLIVVGPADQPTVRLSHPLYGELLRAGTPALGRLRHLRRLADALEAGGPPGEDDRIRIALWRLDAGGPVDPQLMLAAAEHAAINREYDLAYRFAHQAYRAGWAVPAGLTCVRALVQLGRVDDAIALCVELADLVRPAGSDLDRLLVAVEHAEILVHVMDDVPAARSAVARARHDRAAANPDGVDAEAACPMAAFDLYLRSYQLDCAVTGPALAVVRSSAPLPAWLAASAAAGCALLLAGRHGEAEALVAETVPLTNGYAGASQLQSAGVSPMAAVLRCYRPDPDGALAVAESGYEASLHPTNPVSQALHCLVLAQIALMRGRPRTAMRWAQEARLVAGEIHMRPVCRWAAGVRMQAAAQLGDDTDLADSTADLHRYGSGPQSLRLFDIEVARAYAWRGAATGDGGVGLAALATAVAAHGRTGAAGFGALGALDLIRLGASGQAAELLAAYPIDPGWLLGATIVGYATAAHAADPIALLDVAGSFARYGMPLHAAEAATLAGSAWLASGDLPGVARAQLFADAQLGRTGEPASTPALRRRGPIVKLTGREREIVFAAARGEQSRSIAGRLHLSERTVENHLHRAYTKLGITGRAELRAALGLN